MVQHRRDQTELHQAHDRGLVGLDHRVVGLGANPHERGIQDVDKEEEENRGTGNAMQDPGPHSWITTV
ncbi:Uncharacterised protein [Mycobacteroides abscessus subsp. abscessus]|nr:Uncharacterised protein [Mycobacteroides abscessus subsp. abscessus]